MKDKGANQESSSAVRLVDIVSVLSHLCDALEESHMLVAASGIGDEANIGAYQRPESNNSTSRMIGTDKNPG